MLPSAVDDIEMGVTDVLRGEDHVSNTAAQIQMFTALGAEPPRFAHEALLVGSEGKLSKRLGALGCDAFRERGIEPAAQPSAVSNAVPSPPVEPIAERALLVESFDLAHFGRAPARFDDEIELAVRVVELGTTSMSTAIDATRASELLVEGRMRHVFIDPATLAKQPIPPGVRERLADYAP